MLYAEVCPGCGEKSTEEEKLCPFCGKEKMEFINPGDDSGSYNPFKIISYALAFLLIVLSLAGSSIIHPIDTFLQIGLILCGIASFIYGRWFT